MANRENQKERMDELAITKAAAWAWYERGSWFEHNSIRETDCRRSSDYTRRPTRYKLEAMNNPPNKSTHDAQPFTNGSLLCTEHLGNSLLDMYEIKRISMELDCYIGSSDVKHRRKSVDCGGYGGVVSFPEDRVGKRESKSKTKTKTKTEKRKGFWIGRPIVCGSTGDDVVNSNLLVGGRRRQKEHVDKVAGIINFRRSITHGLFR
ncbi:hypothetical protein Lser_V15G39811 [Lactuca serriola]|uniref:Uncharacterized protein n=1 Tax=Lactuca sativa TaxID=4236 RepID=A0A9R1WXX3_LACSA|nr:hypothetical protein LSAT_V11C800435800 [Lactuca sativa]